jgi:hypothetical protein
VRAARVLGLTKGASFSEKVVYIYRKQLEEADIIVINKTDLLSPAQLEELRAAFAKEFPKAELLSVSARDGQGLDAWFSRLETGEQARAATMKVDYDVYADGEALLGWYNSTATLTAAAPFDADAALTKLAREIQNRLRGQNAEVAHLKMTFSPDEALAGEIAAVNLVRNDFVPELSIRLQDHSAGGQLIINLRAENAPDALAETVRASLAAIEGGSAGIAAKIEHIEHFRPGRPTPTHRDEEPAAK